MGPTNKRFQSSNYIRYSFEEGVWRWIKWPKPAIKPHKRSAFDATLLFLECSGRPFRHAQRNQISYGPTVIPLLLADHWTAGGRRKSSCSGRCFIKLKKFSASDGKTSSFQRVRKLRDIYPMYQHIVCTCQFDTKYTLELTFALNQSKSVLLLSVISTICPTFESP